MDYASEPLVQKLDIKFDMERITEEVMLLMSQQHLDYLRDRTIKQFSLRCRPGTSEPGIDGVGKQPALPLRDLEEWQRSFSDFHPKYKEWYLAEVSRTFPIPVGRMRLMVLQARACYSVHRDPQPRYHIPVETNPQCFIAYPGHPDWYHMPAGEVYKVHTWRDHVAMNGGDGWRVHLVFDALETYQR